MARSSLVFNVQHYSLHDGPGIRTVVFLKGCPLRCLWCCNPESQRFHAELYYSAKKCIGSSQCGFCRDACTRSAIQFNEQAHVIIERNTCTNCFACVEVCPSKALEIKGVEQSIDAILEQVERDSIFYKKQSGGLTLSGGEPLMHPDLIIPLLKEAKKRRINIAMETCGFGDYATLHEVAKYLDTILFDIKSMDEIKHLEYTKMSNEKILENFECLCQNFPHLPKIVRTPVIPNFNDTPEAIEAIGDFLKGKPNVHYELLPYHRFGEDKYTALGQKYTMPPLALDREHFESLKKSAYLYLDQI